MDDATFIALGLSKAGFGRADLIREMPTDLVLDMLDFSNFSADYSETVSQLNRPEGVK